LYFYTSSVVALANSKQNSMESFSTTRFHLGTTLIDSKSYPEFLCEKAEDDDIQVALHLLYACKETLCRIFRVTRD